VSSQLYVLARRWRILTLICLTGLFAVVAAWQLAAQWSLAAGVRASVLVLPLLFPAYGLWQGKRYTYRWATLCVLPYFIVGLTETVANPQSRLWAAAMLALALAWFVSLVGFLRVTPSSAKFGGQEPT
jgi:uncharacterized membrane protein